MGENRLEASKQIGPGPSDKLRFKIAAIVIVTVIIVSALVFVFRDGTEEDLEIRPETGDYFDYTITMKCDGNITSGDLNRSYMGGIISTTSYLTNWTMGYGILLGYLDDPYLSDPQMKKASAFEDRAINTTLGEKEVTTYVYCKGSSNVWFVMIKDIGIDSGLIYRCTISNENTTVVIALNDTNNGKVADADTSGHSHHLYSFDHPGSPWSCYLCEGSGVSTDTLMTISDGERISYNCTDLDATILFISASDIQKISENMTFQCNEALSQWNATVLDAAGIPGNYFVLTHAMGIGSQARIYLNWGGSSASS